MIAASANNDILVTKVDNHHDNVASTDYDATYHRQWHQISPPPADDNNIISIMSYNLLSQHYMWDEVFGCLNQDYLNWQDYRFPLLTKTIQQFNCDIICLQELESAIYKNYWAHNFPRDHYQSMYIRKTKPHYWGAKSEDHIDGVGIFINRKRFDINRHQEIHFSEFMRQHATMFSMGQETVDRLAPRNNVALIMELYDKQMHKVVYVANTHLYWSPKYCDVKLLQTKLLLDVLDEFINTSPHHDGDQDPNIIICGDLNSTYQSSVYKFLNGDNLHLDGCNDFKSMHIDKFYNKLINDNNLTNPFALDYAYLPLIESKKLTFTSYASDLKAILDHIWLSKGKFKTVKLLGEVNDSYMKNIIGFPTPEFPSDHIPLYVELAYRL